MNMRRRLQQLDQSRWWTRAWIIGLPLEPFECWRLQQHHIVCGSGCPADRREDLERLASTWHPQYSPHDELVRLALAKAMML